MVSNYGVPLEKENWHVANQNEWDRNEFEAKLLATLKPDSMS